MVFLEAATYVPYTSSTTFRAAVVTRASRARSSSISSPRLRPSVPCVLTAPSPSARAACAPDVPCASPFESNNHASSTTSIRAGGPCRVRPCGKCSTSSSSPPSTRRRPGTPTLFIRATLATMATLVLRSPVATANYPQPRAISALRLAARRPPHARSGLAHAFALRSLTARRTARQTRAGVAPVSALIYSQSVAILSFP